MHLERKRSYSGLSLIFSFSLVASVIVTGCNNGGNDDDATTGPAFPPIEPSIDGKLRDNLVGSWMLTSESIEQPQADSETATVTRRVFHSIVQISSVIEPFDPGLSPKFPVPPSLAGTILDCREGNTFIVVATNPDTATAAYLDYSVPALTPLKIINDSRMEAQKPNGGDVWQKIDVPLDDSGRPLIGTVSYEVTVGAKSTNGTTNVSCLRQNAYVTQASVEGINTAPLIVSEIDLYFEDADRQGFFEITFDSAGSEHFRFNVVEKATSDSITEEFVTDIEDIVVDSEGSILNEVTVDIPRGNDHMSVRWQLNRR